MAKIINLEAIRKSSELLQYVHYISDDDEIITPKFINFELLTSKQAKKRGIDSKYMLMQTTYKYDKALMTLTQYIIIDDKENIEHVKIK